MRYLIYRFMLSPLIRRNYRLRNSGVLPDEWYWADALALRWGYFGPYEKANRP